MELDNPTFKTVVASTPLVSIDLVVRDPKGRILLGRRKNPPAANSWFVPGRRIRKGETVREAFRLTAKSELDRLYEVEDATFIGVFEHFYEDDFQGEGDRGGTHYVVLAYEIDSTIAPTSLPSAQHAEYAWLAPDELGKRDDVHANTKAFLSGTARCATQHVLGLYGIYQGAISYYTNIVWAFPAATIAMNAVAWAVFGNSHPRLMIGLSLLNFLLLQAFFKLVANQRIVVDTIQAVERVLQPRFGASEGVPLVPRFRHVGILRRRSADWLKWALFVLFGILLVTSLTSVYGSGGSDGRPNPPLPTDGASPRR